MGNIEELAVNPLDYNNGCRNLFVTWEAEIHATISSSLLLPMSWIKMQLKCLCICHQQTSKFRLDRGLRSSTHLLYQKKVEQLLDICVSALMGL